MILEATTLPVSSPKKTRNQCNIINAAGQKENKASTNAGDLRLVQAENHRYLISIVSIQYKIESDDLKTHTKVTVRMIEGMHFRAEDENGRGFDMDSELSEEPRAGTFPMNAFLQAAAGCTAMDAVFVLRKRRLEPERFEVLVEGIKRKEHPRIYTEINLVYRAKGPGITIAEMERAAGLSLETYCGAFGMLKQVAKVNWRCELIE